MNKKRSRTNTEYFEDIEPEPKREGRWRKFHKDKEEKRGKQSKWKIPK